MLRIKFLLLTLAALVAMAGFVPFSFAQEKLEVNGLTIPAYPQAMKTNSRAYVGNDRAIELETQDSTLKVIDFYSDFLTKNNFQIIGNLAADQDGSLNIFALKDGKSFSLRVYQMAGKTTITFVW